MATRTPASPPTTSRSTSTPRLWPSCAIARKDASEMTLRRAARRDRRQEAGARRPPYVEARRGPAQVLHPVRLPGIRRARRPARYPTVALRPLARLLRSASVLIFVYYLLLTLRPEPRRARDAAADRRRLAAECRALRASPSTSWRARPRGGTRAGRALWERVLARCDSASRWRAPRPS